MSYPGVNLHRLYSLNLYEDLDIIFEDLRMLDYSVLQKIRTNRLSITGDIHLIPNILKINTEEKTIRIIGHKINKSTYIVNSDGNGTITNITYPFENEYIYTALEYIYQIYTNIHTDTSKTEENIWRPRIYVPEF